MFFVYVCLYFVIGAGVVAFFLDPILLVLSVLMTDKELREKYSNVFDEVSEDTIVKVTMVVAVIFWPVVLWTLYKNM